MSTVSEVVIVSAVRTAVGSFGGSLKDVEPCKLGELVIAESIRRAGIEASDVGHVVLGNVIHTEARDMYISRVAALNAGVPKEAPALTVNRLCGSGIQAIVSAAQSVMLGDAAVAVAGGAESMSRSGHLLPNMRWGQRLGDGAAIDMMLGALHDPFGHGHMGITAENVADRYGISREQQDAFALASHTRATSAIEAGHFDSQILTVEVKNRRQVVEFKEDEHVRKDATIDDMTKLRPAFKADGGSVTAGNASGLNDGAAALVLMSKPEAERRGLKPMARILGYAHAGVEPSEMGIGPVPAVKKLLQRTGLTTADIDLFESNEAFAAQACAVNKELGLSEDKVNVNGGAVALGHPIGATGAIISTKLLYELQRTGKQHGIATMCIGGGQGIALAVEAI
ncbi:MAG: acetyl-CoA C-acyltransferase family protein [Pseudomonadota bacterium]